MSFEENFMHEVKKDANLKKSEKSSYFGETKKQTLWISTVGFHYGAEQETEPSSVSCLVCNRRLD